MGIEQEPQDARTGESGGYVVRQRRIEIRPDANLARQQIKRTGRKWLVERDQPGERSSSFGNDDLFPSRGPFDKTERFVFA